MINFKMFILLLLLFLTASVFAANIVPFPELKKPETIIIDQNEIIITGFPHVYIYSLKDFKLINKFGEAGEGPREFFKYTKVQPHPDYPDNILVNSHMKISFFTRKGEYVKEIRAKSSSAANVYKPVGKKYAAYGLIEDGLDIYTTIEIYDSNLKKIKEMVRWKGLRQHRKPFNPTGYDLFGGEFRVYDKKIFVLLREEGNIEVFDDDGRKLFSINYDYKRRPVTANDKKEFHNFYRTDKRYASIYEFFKTRMEFPKYFPSTRCSTLADNRIYVLTNNKEGGKYEFVIFDIKGKFLKKIMVPLENANPREPYPFTINDGKLYQLIDNEKTEEWELHIHPIQ